MDFRVQQEHGDSIIPFVPDAALLKESHLLLDKIPFDLLYSRMDMLYWRGHYVLMEIELIEPALYFRTNSQSVRNYKEVIDKIFTPH